MAALLWEITLVGPFCANYGEHRILHFRTRKTAALLAYLACNPQRPQRREAVMELIWPDYAPAAARNVMGVTLSHLRKVLNVDGAPPLLVSTGDYLSLDSAVCTTDRRVFAALVEEARQVAEEAGKLLQLQRAIDLCQGELLPNFDDEWALGERQRWNDTYLIVLRQIIKMLAATRTFEPALDYARRALQMDRYREESYRTLMHLYVLSGRPEAAVPGPCAPVGGRAARSSFGQYYPAF